MKALLLVLSCLLVLAAGCGGSYSGNPNSTSSSDQAGTGADVSAASGPDKSSANTSTDKVVITTSMDLRVPNVRDAYSDIGSTVRGMGGYVAEGRIAGGERDTGSLRLRVPATRHDELLASLRNMGGAKVAAESSNAKEVTAEYSDLDAQLHNLQRSEAQYQELLGRAGSISDVVQVSAKLDGVRGRIESARGRLNVLNDTTDFATVNVALAPSAVATSGLAKPVEVFQAGLTASRVIALLAVNAAIVGLLMLAWVVPSGLVLLFAWRRMGRRLKSIGARLTSW